MSLEVSCGMVRFRNPLVLASGTFGYGQSYTNVINEAGAFVTKGITVKPKPGNPPPRIWDTRETVVNSVGLENVGLERFKQDVLPKLDIRTPLYVNLAGTTVDDFCLLVSALNGEEKITGFELNLSCPNVKEGGATLGQSSSSVGLVTASVRALTRKPVWVKLTSNFCDVRETSKSAEDHGADAVVIVNTLNALVIDTDRRRPFMGAGSGGLSGPALKPHVTYLVREVYTRLKIPVIASGGVVSARDLLDHMLAGASLVEVGSANLVNPEACLSILKELKDWFSMTGVKTTDEIIGQLEVQ